MARRLPRGIVVSEVFLKNETILTTMRAPRTTKPCYTSAAAQAQHAFGKISDVSRFLDGSGRAGAATGLGANTRCKGIITTEKEWARNPKNKVRNSDRIR